MRIQKTYCDFCNVDITGCSHDPRTVIIFQISNDKNRAERSVNYTEEKPADLCCTCQQKIADAILRVVRNTSAAAV